MRSKALVAVATLALAVAANAADLAGEQARSLDPVQYARLLAARQNWPEAAVAFEAAIQVSPQDPSLHNMLGICYQRLGEHKAARRAYEQALKVRPNYAEALNNLGTLEHARGRYKQAIAAYEKAIAIKPSDATLFRNLGTAWLARGQVEKALASWNDAVRLDPAALEGSAESRISVSGGVDLAQQYFLYAKLLASRGEVSKAIECLTRAQAAGFRDFDRVERDRDFAALLADARYAALK